MLKFKKLEDINDYYESKGITPYWREYENNGWLKLEHIQIITERFDYLLKLYPDLKLNGIGDYYSFAMDYYEKHGWNPKFIKPTYEHDMFGERYDKDDKGRDINASYKTELNSILIVHNSKLLYIGNNLKEELSSTITHEFGHALDNQYNISKNPLMIDYYNKMERTIAYVAGIDEEPIEEFVAGYFELSFCDNYVVSEKVRLIIDEIIFSN